MIRRTDLERGIVLLTIETPGPVNTLTKAFNHAFLALVEEVLADASVKGIVISSAKDGFAAGGDLDELRAARTPEDIVAIVSPFLLAIRKLETWGRPVVAALNGTALGGGYELALGCHRRIAADRPDALYGLPEAGLGLMPGAGGTQRLPRLIGMQAAADLILPGRTLDAATALKAGLIDAVVPAGELLDACTDWIAANPEPAQPWDRKGWTLPGLDPNTVKGRNFLTGAWARMRAKSAATNEAGTAILHTLHHGLERTLDAGIAVETRQFARLAVSDGARNRMRVLHYGTRAARPSVKPDGSLRTIAVAGGGQMGTGIAYAAALAGLSVVLVEVSREKAHEARGRIGKLAERQVGRGRLAADAAAAAGVAGRLAVWVDGTELHVANTGSPLTDAGVRSLAALRVSAKTADDSGARQIGRFGGGFTDGRQSHRDPFAQWVGGLRPGGLDGRRASCRDLRRRARGRAGAAAGVADGSDADRWLRHRGGPAPSRGTRPASRRHARPGAGSGRRTDCAATDQRRRCRGVGRTVGGAGRRRR